jgi:glycosyltransferase involved in cell wall biosynthesis
MNVLFLNRFLPHAGVRNSGGLDVYHYISALSQDHSVSLISFVTADQDAALESMRDVCTRVVAVPYSLHGLLPRLWRAAWRVLLPRVYGRVVSIPYLQRLRQMLSQTKYDLVIVDGMMAPYSTLIRGPQTVLDEWDIYSILAYHNYRNEKRALPRAWLLLDWLRTQAFELHYAGSCDSVLVRSEQDREILHTYLPDQRIEVVAPWFEGLAELCEVEAIRPEGNHLLFVGAMYMPANVEAVTFFVHQVFPLVRSQVPDAEFQIVGSAPTHEVQKLASEEGVQVVGEVPDLTPYYQQCAVNVVPRLTGGGIIVKTLNGLAAARPTVTTHAGNSGTGARSGRDLLIVDPDPEAFAAAVVRLLTDLKLWEQLAISGRRYIAENYDWQVTCGVLENLVRRARA